MVRPQFDVFRGQTSSDVFSSVAAFSSFGALILGIVDAIKSAILSVQAAVVYVVTQFGHFFGILGSSILLLIELVPRTIYHSIVNMKSLIQSLAISLFECVASMIQAFRSAPVEMMLGFAAGVVIIYSSVRLSLKLVRDLHITPGLVLATCLNILLRIYFNFVRLLMTSVCLIFHGLTSTLAHLHVPRFHHAGDSDNEADNGVISHYDSSDNEERERQQMKRRNYDLLLQRREIKLKNRLNKSRTGEDVEDMLFEQVEREREDKLCVICQDKEKCIMILPCRHLCICQACQTPLKNLGNNVCPICRKKVRQMIKAYL